MQKAKASKANKWQQHKAPCMRNVWLKIMDEAWQGLDWLSLTNRTLVKLSSRRKRY